MVSIRSRPDLSVVPAKQVGPERRTALVWDAGWYLSRVMLLNVGLLAIEALLIGLIAIVLHASRVTGS